MGVKKNKKLWTIFLEYVLSLGAIITVLLLVHYFLFTSQAFVYPANYSERIVQKNYQSLKDSPKVSQELLTPMSSFGVYSPEGHFLYGNLSPEKRETYWASYIKGSNTLGLANYIVAIEREDDLLIISYPLAMQFKNEGLAKVFPNADLTLIVLFLLQLLLLLVFWSNKFAKRVNSELKILFLTTEKIAEQRLDFIVPSSKIKEVEEVLQGIAKMKDALKDSLEQQWSMERQKREQIAALAHDLKTPLTIVKGNVQLLGETDLNEEQKSYSAYLGESSEQMETYIQKLLAFTKNEPSSKEQPNENIQVEEFLNFLSRQSQALSAMTNIKVAWTRNIPENLGTKVCKNEFSRAILNVLKNAFDFSPAGSTIFLEARANDEQLTILVKDQGQGFSGKMLKHGKEQFAMANESRTKSGHHGLGLFIANTIVRRYEGEIHLANDEDGGGLVRIIIPIQ